MGGMSAPSIHRVLAGNGIESGRFARAGHADSGVELGADLDTAAIDLIDHKTPMVVALTELARDHCEAADGDLYPEFCRYAAALPAREAQTHWAKLTRATSNFDRFADPDAGEDAAEDALEAGDPAIVGNRSLSDYERFNEADRPGENDYIGFDFPQAAEDLAADWEAKVDAAAIDTVRAVSRAEAQPQPISHPLSA